MAIRIRFLSALLSIAVIAACSSVPPPVPSPSGSGTPAVAAGSPASATGSSSPLASPAAQPPPTSEQLIAGALVAGMIDYETSIRYRAYALYGDPRLPQPYQSQVIDYEAGASLAADVGANKDKLSAATVAEIAPFLVRPNDPASIFSQVAPSAATGHILGGPRQPASSFARPRQARQVGPADRQTAVATWVSAMTPGGEARIWAEDSPGTPAALQALASDVVAPIWSMLRKFFRAPLPDAGKAGSPINPDPAIDIYLVNFDDIDPRSSYCASHPLDTPGYAARCQVAGHLGMAPRDDPRFDNKSSGYVLVKIGQGGDAMRATIAHELFHVAQDALDNAETSWLEEATAEWGEFRILHELGWSLDCGQCAHAYLPSFYGRFPSGFPLTTADGASEYGAYLYFYFAQMVLGDDAVFKIWQAAAAEDEQGAQAVDQVLPFRKNFPRYALRSWNREPVDPLYRNERDPSFPEKLIPFDYEGRTEISMTGARTAPLHSDLDQLGIRYFHFDFLDPQVRTVVFHDPLVGNPDAAVQALVRIGDVWQKPRDWTGQDKVTFCRDAPDQDVRELVIIISNSNLTNPLAPGTDPSIEGKPEPCGHWAGTVSKTYTKKMVTAALSDSENGSISASVTWEVDPKAAMDANNAVVYKPVAGQLAWQFKATITAAGLTCTSSGSGSVPLATLDYSDLGYDGRDGYLVTWTEPSGQRLYGANGVIISKEDVFPLKYSCLSGPFTPNWETGWLHTTDDPDKEAPYGGLPIPDSGHISGTDTKDGCTGPVDPGSIDTCTWTWDFQLVP